MSSVHKQKSKPCWFCAFYDPEGYRRFRTTGMEEKQIARTVCTAIDRAAKLARLGKLSNEKALKLVRETRSAIEDTHGKILADRAEKALAPIVEEFVRMAGGELTRYTVASWLESWMAGHTAASKATLVEYRRIVDLFKKFLGARSDAALTTLHPSQVEGFKAHLMGRVGASTVNKAVKVLKAAFGKAVKSRQLEFSPAEHVEFVETEAPNRRPFTPEELKALWSAATGDWLTMLFLGRYTGQRLNDCASLTWENADLVKHQIELMPKKVMKSRIKKNLGPLKIPMHPALHRHLSSIAGDDPKAPLCPSLRGKASSKLSDQFHAVMVKAGLAEKRSHEGTGKGRDGKRDASKVSFHSLRYNATTELKEAGVAVALVMEIIGHESREVSRDYTGFDDETIRQAVNKMREV